MGYIIKNIGKINIASPKILTWVNTGQKINIAKRNKKKKKTKTKTKKIKLKLLLIEGQEEGKKKKKKKRCSYYHRRGVKMLVKIDDES